MAHVVKKKPVKKIIKQKTREQWLRFVERSIVKSQYGKKIRIKTKDGTGLHSQNSWDWLGEMMVEVINSIPKDGRMRDPNMFVARRLGIVLLTWFVRVSRAKCFDPRRPLVLRKKAYALWLENLSGITSLLMDDRDDPKIWPGQKWDNPFGKNAKGGKFV